MVIFHACARRRPPEELLELLALQLELTPIADTFVFAAMAALKAGTVAGSRHMFSLAVKAAKPSTVIFVGF